MARIAGVDLPRNKRTEIALTYIFGIGQPTAKKICKAAKVDGNKKTDELSETDMQNIREILEKFDFADRPSRSRYAEVVKALVQDNVHAVKLERGKDFPNTVKMDTVQAGVSTAVRKAGKRARTRVLSQDVLVVGLNSEPAPKRRGGKRALTTA